MKNLLLILLLISITVSAQDKPDGPAKLYYRSGELKTEGVYKNQKRVGEWKRYYKSGQISNISSYTNGKKEIPEASFFESGIVKRKVEKEGEGYIVFGYYETGELFYKNQYKSGYYKEYRENGSLKIESNYIDFQLSGKWKFYDEDENLEWSVSYENGYRNGIYKQFYKNKNLRLEGVILRDKKNGEEKRYDELGNLQWVGSYKGDAFSKTWVKYDSSGKKVEKVNTKKKTLPFKVTAVPDGVLEKVPVFTGCENVYGNKALKKCMNENLAKFILDNFDKNEAKNIGLLGKQKILVAFKIDKLGYVSLSSVKAPHHRLRIETQRVFETLPRITPGYQRGKPVIVPYALPIVFYVQ
ncbi:toxin-antitoxin system YwqK family antitoxin [uncultured Winogradskyella sp.]|uniref:toxin-antitoxin system YwqK family antitoxin n=1 Tax=uncultured Winogradskyella sp. TaxID=395353 RepID=UPI002617BD92|nr:toxin-antitoxin system YwqK family antitoxin [uncultured Winogradskyella sp.]